MIQIPSTREKIFKSISVFIQIHAQLISHPKRDRSNRISQNWYLPHDTCNNPQSLNSQVQIHAPCGKLCVLIPIRVQARIQGFISSMTLIHNTAHKTRYRSKNSDCYLSLERIVTSITIWFQQSSCMNAMR